MVTRNLRRDEWSTLTILMKLFSLLPFMASTATCSRFKLASGGTSDSRCNLNVKELHRLTSEVTVWAPKDGQWAKLSEFVSLPTNVYVAH